MREIDGNVIFCEDIRSEENGQVSYIGVFPTQRGMFDVDDDGDIRLPRFSMACYLKIPTEYAGEKPQVVVRTLADNGDTSEVASDTMTEVPRYQDKRVAAGLLHIQLVGFSAKPDQRVVVDLYVADKEKRIGSFRLVGRSKSETLPDIPT
ncbi:hypothetical protein Q5698_08445 [Brucella intermedia]|uniref:hypothetical protein n=1 Tax=Brucella TaxID=234 RepID=UPI00224AB892|nr:hypothetical protein [Brucella intermedia]WLF95699.1 hypothetical protein Q5698_08445 [Brucella intermedia]WPM80889.1 hypothetical protein R5W60_04095 [Brucella pseudintermedia]